MQDAIYPVTIGTRTIDLPIVALAGIPVKIALADTLGDLPLCDFLAEALIAQTKANGQDPAQAEVILTAGKSLTLADAIARRLGLAQLAVAEKRAKSFWHDAYAVPSKSITGGEQENLVIGGRRAALLAGRRILVVDDVISTGESIHALIAIAEHFGTVAQVMAPFVEGDQQDVLTQVAGYPAASLAYLPVWPQA